MRKNMMALAAAAALACTALSGCGSSGGGQTTAAPGTTAGTTAGSSETTAKDSTAASGEKKEVVIWDYFETDAQKAMMQSLIEGFNSSQDQFTASHVYVPFSDYEKQLTLGIASGELPDLVILDGCTMASFISLGLFGDISDAKIAWEDYLAVQMSFMIF